MNNKQILFGSIDEPENDQVICGIAHVVGWLLSPIHDDLQVMINIDEKPIAVKTQRYPRPDVIEKYPELSLSNPYPGFISTFNTFDLPDGRHTITCIGESKDQSVIISEVKIKIENKNKLRVYEHTLWDIQHHLQMLENSDERLRQHVHELNRMILSLIERITRMEIQSSSGDEIWDKTRTRWRKTKPQIGLTWGQKLSGDGFITKAESYKIFDPSKVILEIGPGYGRLLETCLARGVPFKEYVGVDISAENIDYLTKAFSDRSDLLFINEDVEKVRLDRKIDVVISSLTLKHLYPTFENALRNIIQYVNSGGIFFFDLIEGEGIYIHEEQLNTYVKHYTRGEVSELIKQLNLELIAFDEVEHGQGFTRLLVIAQKP